ncbi:MAG: hypothetical protein AAGC64_09785 [Bacteroidota bacterium]
MVKKYILQIILCCAFIACNTSELEFDDLNVPPITGVFDVPLGDITYTMSELLDEINPSDLNLLEDSSNFLTLFYIDSLNYSAGDDFVEIDDISGRNTLSSIPVEVGPITVSLAEQFTQSYNPNSGEQLDSVYHDRGELSLTVSSDVNATLNYTVTFNNTIRTANRTPMTFVGSLPGAGLETQSQPLQNHVTRLNNTSGSNEFTVSFEIEIVLAENQSLDGTEDISIDFTYGNQTFNLIYGKFGQDSVSLGRQSINIDLFDDFGDGIFFGNPIFRFKFGNEFGIPVAVDFSGVSGDDGNGNNQVFLSGNIVDVLPEIGAAANPGETEETTIEINKSNSNIVQLLSNSPSRLVFDIVGISNFYDNDQSNFVQPDNEISTLIEVEVPMEVRLEDFEVTFGYGLEDGLDTEDFDSAFLRVVTFNELPFSGSLTMEIQDATETSLFTIPEALVFDVPFIDVNGFVTDPSGSFADIPLSPEAIEALTVGSRIEMIVTLNTPVSLTSREIFVKILTTYKLEIKLGIGARVNIEID